MAQVPKPNQQTDLSSIKPPEIDPKDVSVDRLIDDSLYAIYREVKNILYASSKGKLDANSARDLRDYTKLLFELKARENDSLKGLTDEQLEAKAKEVLSDDKK